MTNGVAVERQDVYEVLNTGCALTELKPLNTPNILLRLPDENAYATYNPSFFGVTVGRVANRVSDARLDLNGQRYELSRNGDGGTSCLHGGERGWGMQRWQGPSVERRKDASGEWREQVQRYVYRSEHLDQGFPGVVEARVWWSCRVEDGKVVLEAEYEAEMLDDQPEGVDETVVSMTNHAYFNLSPTCHTDAPTLAGTLLTIPTTAHLALYTNNIPTGAITTFPEYSVFEANEPVLFGDNLPVLDHCFILDPDADPASIPLDTRGRPMRMIVDMLHPKTSVVLHVETTEPAFQLYSGDGIDVRGGTTDNGITYGPRAGIAIEPGRYTDAASRDEWKGMVALRRGDIWGSRTRWTTWKDDADAC